MLFKELGIAGVSAKYRTAAEVKAAKEQAQKQGALASAAAAAAAAAAAEAAAGAKQQKKTKGKPKPKGVGHSKRGASDHFLLEASLEGVATEILRDHSTVRTHMPMRRTSIVLASCA